MDLKHRLRIAIVQIDCELPLCKPFTALPFRSRFVPSGMRIPS